jgi:hypothetical protein
VIRTKDLRATQRDLLDAWRRVEVPAGCAWQPIVEASRADQWKPRLGVGSDDRAVRLFRAASSAHGGREFPLSYEILGHAIGVTWNSARGATRHVIAAGWVEVVTPGTRGRNSRQATVWRWTGP